MPLRRLVLERLMLYHRFLAEERERGRTGPVTSAELAGAIDVDPTQVRKDFAAIGLRGKGRVGFDAADAQERIRQVLGFDRTKRAVLVGVGHLGGALLAYENFGRYGLEITAAFDTDPAKIGSEIAGCRVRPLRSLKSYLTRNAVPLAIVATPAEAAQDVADLLVGAGVRAIWNFAPRRLDLPPHVFLRDEHISLGLAELGHHLAG